MYTVFNKNKNDQLVEPMFFGQNVNVSRYDQQKYKQFEKLTERQLSFFWRPEEVDVSKDRIDYNGLSPAEQHIFLSNLKYQTLLDSIQGRSPNMAFLPVVSLPELETWIETWAFEESIHSRSYTHIIRNIVNNPSLVFDDIVLNEQIQKRAESVSHYYDDFIKAVTQWEAADRPLWSLAGLKRKLYLCLMNVNILEGIRFYVSFACSFAFGERSLMEGNAKIIKFISRDESLHLVGTQRMLNLLKSGKDDPAFKQIAEDCRDECKAMFDDAIKQEKEWAEYLFKDGSMIGLNKDILCDYVDHIAAHRMKAVGLYDGSIPANPIPWIDNWLLSDNVQVAPQEAELSSYLTGQIDSTVDINSFSGFDL